ncbi:WD40-repeat-containing domain protein [Dichotomocladium elegans]|nr:WD40-repeat-containing domain protein [Dichotomocladium elegans]
MSAPFLAPYHSSLTQSLVHHPDRKDQGRQTVYIAIISKRNSPVRTKCLNPNAIGARAQARGHKRAFNHSSNNSPLPFPKLTWAMLPKKAKSLTFWSRRPEELAQTPASLSDMHGTLSLTKDKHNKRCLPLETLPFEIIHKILLSLDAGSILRLGQTSRALYALCHSNHVWSSLLYEDFHMFQRSADYERLYQDRKALGRRWKEGHARVHYLDDKDGHQGCIYSLAWLDHRTILSTSRDRTIKIWDIFTRQCLATYTSSHQGSILCVAIAPSGKYAVTGSSDRSCIVWSVQSNKSCNELQRYTKHHDQSVMSVVFIHNDVVVTGSRDATLCIWNVLRGDTLHVLRGHTGAVNVVKVLGSDDRVVSGSADGTVRIWCTATGSCLQTLESQIGGISCLQVVVDERERTIWAGGIIHHRIQIWSSDGDVRTMTTPSGHTDLMRCLDAIEDRVVTVGYDKVIKIWDTQTGRCAVNFQSGHEGRIFCVLMGRTTVISAGYDKRIMVLNFGHGLSSDLSK